LGLDVFSFDNAEVINSNVSVINIVLPSSHLFVFSTLIQKKKSYQCTWYNVQVPVVLTQGYMASSVREDPRVNILLWQNLTRGPGGRFGRSSDNELIIVPDSSTIRVHARMMRVPLSTFKILQEQGPQFARITCVDDHRCRIEIAKSTDTKRYSYDCFRKRSITMDVHTDDLGNCVCGTGVILVEDGASPAVCITRCWSNAAQALSSALIVQGVLPLHGEQDDAPEGSFVVGEKAWNLITKDIFDCKGSDKNAIIFISIRGCGEI
jgi:hypothetical protein